MKIKIAGFFILILWIVSCSDDKNLQNNNLKNQVLTELFLIKAEDFDNGQLEVNRDVIMKVDTLIEKLQSIDSLQNSDLLLLNLKLKAIIESTNIGDSIKTDILKNFQDDKDNEISINSVLINSQTTAFFLKKKYYDNLFHFDLLKPVVRQVYTDSGKVLEVQLMVASSRYRPNIYLGNRDTIQIDEWYRYKMSNYQGDHFIERILLKENYVGEGLYQIHTGKGNLLIRFNTKQK